MKIKAACIVLLIISTVAHAENRFGPDDLLQVRIENLDREGLSRLIQMGTDIDGVWGTVARAYMFPDRFEELRKLGYNLAVISDPARRSSDLRQGYHTYEELTSLLKAVEAEHPDICRLYNIGYSNEGRELWFMKISDNVNQEEDEPEFSYISTMHGDEPVGTELCLNLINILTEEYGTDQQITTLVNEIEIWIMPLMNPDGYANSSRYNAMGTDLNRDFPDRIGDPVNTVDGRQIETQHIMNWTFNHSPVLSANLHTGEAVVNYPFDSDADKSADYSSSPDDDLFIHQSLTYSSLNETMYNSSYFKKGIVNGVEWYLMYGGMQDWNYVWMGCNQVTIELNKVKWPPYSEIQGLWDENRKAMLAYMELCLNGVRGVVTDIMTEKPLNARIQVVSIDHDVYTDPDVGDYHRMLVPGTYNIRFLADGYQSQTITDVVVDSGNALRLDMALFPEGYSNHPPEFTPGTNQTVNEDAGQIIVEEWASDISPGPEYESNQKLIFNLTTDNDALFEVKPAVDPLNGSLTFMPAQNNYGSAFVTITLQDDGGTDNGGIDLSPSYLFTITVTPVNDRPDFTAGPDQTVYKQSTMITVKGWASNISPGPENESDQKFTFEVVTDKNALFAELPEVDPVTGDLAYTLSENAYGSALVKVTLQDSGGTENSGIDTGYPRIFSITVRFLPGDIDGSGVVNMGDLILALQILSGIHPSQKVFNKADVNNDGKIGTEEVIYILQTCAERLNG